jgi:isochorismate hydrolase
MRSTAYICKTSIDDRAESWLEEIRSGIAPRSHLELEPSRAALLVVDMVQYFADEGGRCFLPAAGVIIPGIARLVKCWRGLGRPVVFTRHCHRVEDDLGMMGRFFSDYIHAGKPEAEIVRGLAPLSGEVVIEKNTYDAFIGTELEATLKDMNVDQLIITGVLTHMCCDTTARSAFCRSFEVYLPVDALASNSEARHLSSLCNLADAVAIPMSIKEVLSLCQSNR